MVFKAISHELSKIEKLSGTNFSTWKRRIWHILYQVKFKYTIDSPLSPSKENVSTTIRKNYEIFLKDSKNAREIMYMEPNAEIMFEEYKLLKLCLMLLM